LICLDNIKEKVEELAFKINAPIDLLPTYGYTKDFAYPHIEVDIFGFLHYVIVELGQELDRRTTSWQTVSCFEIRFFAYRPTVIANQKI
jgi:hypothetical protein